MLNAQFDRTAVTITLSTFEKDPVLFTCFMDHILPRLHDLGYGHRVGGYASRRDVIIYPAPSTVTAEIRACMPCTSSNTLPTAD